MKINYLRDKKMKNTCTREDFLETVKEHEMTVIKDDGLDRHLRFKKPNSGNRWFDIVTWKGYLCVTGDMGCWVFSRIDDMFDFFIMSDNDFNKSNIINPGYWEEKLQAISRFGSSDGSTKEFSESRFKEAVKEYFDQYFEDVDEEDESKKEVWEGIESDIFNYIGEYSRPDTLFHRVNEFYEGDFNFVDFDYRGCFDYTYYYIWICYAIVWGIIKYREEKK